MARAEQLPSFTANLRRILTESRYDFRVPRYRHAETLQDAFAVYQGVLSVLPARIPHVAHRNIFVRMLALHTSPRHEALLRPEPYKLMYCGKPMLALTNRHLIARHDDDTLAVARMETHVIVYPDKPEIRWLYFYEMTKTHHAAVDLYSFRDPPKSQEHLVSCLDDLQNGSCVRFSPCESFCITENQNGLDYTYTYRHIDTPVSQTGDLWLRTAYDRIHPTGNSPEMPHENEDNRIMEFGLPAGLNGLAGFS